MNTSSIVRITTGVGVIITAAVVLIGWMVESVGMVQVRETYPPMQYATATGFLMLGAHILRPTAWINCAVLALGVWAMGAIYFNVPGPSVMFPEPWTTVATPIPGEPAPNTATCFFLIAAAYMRRDRPRIAVPALMAAWFIAMISFVGYAFQIVSASQWGEAVTGMSVLTSACFVMSVIGAFSSYLGEARE